VELRSPISILYVMATAQPAAHLYEQEIELLMAEAARLPSLTGLGDQRASVVAALRFGCRRC
jgi:hypothetical protein